MCAVDCKAAPSFARFLSEVLSPLFGLLAKEGGVLQSMCVDAIAID